MRARVWLCVAGAVRWYVSAPSAAVRGRDAAAGSALLTAVVSSPAALQSYSAGVLAGCVSYVACRRAACAASVLLRVSSSSPRVLSLPLSVASVYASGCVAAHVWHCTTYSLHSSFSTSESGSLARHSGDGNSATALLGRYWPFTRPGHNHADCIWPPAACS